MSKKINILIIFIFVLSCKSLVANDLNEIRYIVKHDDYYSFYNIQQELLFTRNYEFVEEIHENRIKFSVLRNGIKFYGFLDVYGNIILEANFQNVKNFSEGYAAVKVDRDWGFIDLEGNYIITPQYIRVNSFESGFAQVTYMNENNQEIIGFINSNNEIVLELNQFDFAYNYSEGLILVGIHQNYSSISYINLNGEIIIPGRFYSANSFSEGLAAVVVKEPENYLSMDYGYINHSGDMEIPYSFKFASNFEDGIAYVFMGRFFQDEEGAWYLINKQGDLIHKFDSNVTRVLGYNEGYFAVQINGRNSTFTDSEGRYITDQLFKRVFPFQNGYAKVWLHDGSENYIDTNGVLLF